MTMVTMVINASNSAVFKHVQAQAPHVIFDCNVLCSTNLVGLLTLPIWFRRDLTPDKLRAVGCRRWLALLVGTLLFQVVGPFFFLKGLAGTSVAQAAVLARLDQVEFYVFALCLLGPPPSDAGIHLGEGVCRERGGPIGALVTVVGFEWYGWFGTRE